MTQILTHQQRCFAGHLEVFAGVAGHQGFRNGHRSSALFDQPRGICADANGSLIVSDSRNGCIRRVTDNGADLMVMYGPNNPEKVYMTSAFEKRCR